MTTEAPTSLLHLAGSKLRNQLGGQLNESASEGVTSKFARAQLEKLGWKEGEGLGKRRQGMATHIKVKKRVDGVGLGESNIDPAIQQSIGNEWWKSSVGDTLARLGNKKSNKKKKGNKKELKENKKSKRIYTDDELFEATGGARFGMRAQTQQRGKWKRAEADISEKEVEEAKRNVEWDGRSAPIVVLKEKESSKKSKKRTREELSDERDDTAAKAERKRKKEEKLIKADADSRLSKKSKKKKKKKEQ